MLGSSPARQVCSLIGSREEDLAGVVEQGYGSHANLKHRLSAVLRAGLGTLGASSDSVVSSENPMVSSENPR